MGDTLMTTPALRLIKEYIPDCEVTFFTFNRATQEILSNNPYIDQLIYKPIKVTNAPAALAHMLTHITFRYTTCINFYPSNRTQYNLFALFTGAKVRLGHRYLQKDFSQLNWLKNRTIKEKFHLHCVEENVRLLKFLNINHSLDSIGPMEIFLTQKERETATSYLKTLQGKCLVGVHAGTSTFKNHRHRRWPTEKFIDLINTLPKAQFLLFGTGDEVKLNQKIKESIANPKQVTVVEHFTLREVCAIIGELDLFISNDSGLMHCAAAMGTPTVALIGPTNPHFIHPWHVPHRIVKQGLSCSPCFYYSPKPLFCKLDNSYACLRDLEVSTVVKASKELLATAGH